MVLVLEQEKTLRKLYESKNNILKNALKKLSTQNNSGKMSNIKSAQDLFTPSFNTNKKNSILDKLQKLNIKKTLTKNNLFLVNHLDMEDFMTKDLATNEMKSELNLLNIETKSLHTPKELDKENLKNFDLNTFNFADDNNYIDTENEDCILYPETAREKECKLTLNNKLISNYSTIQNEETIFNTTPVVRKQTRALSSIGSDLGDSQTKKINNSVQNSIRTKNDEINKKSNKVQLIKSSLINKKCLNNSIIHPKNASHTNPIQNTKASNIKSSNATMKSKSIAKDINKKAPIMKNIIPRIIQKDKNTIEIKKNKIVSPKLNFNVNFKKKNITNSNNSSNLSKKLLILSSENKYSDVIPILENIFGENLENLSDKCKNS